MPGFPDTYYAATKNTEYRGFSPLTEKIQTQVCILGGGYAGLMTALGLLERGIKDVVIVEQHKIGWGASGRNGGFVFGGYSLSPESLVSQVGLEKAQMLYQLTQSGVDLIRKRVKQYRINCDLVDNGVILANWFNEQSLLKSKAQFMADKLNVNWQYLSPSDLKQKLNTKRYYGGLFEPNAMHFHPLNYALGTAQTINQLGGKIFENTQAIKIKLSNKRRVVVTDKGSINCEQVVIAGGGYLSSGKGVTALFADCVDFSGLPKVANSILPIATYVMATEPLGENLQNSINTKAAIYDTRFAFDYYRPLNDSRILWGGRVSALTGRPANLEQQLKSDLLKVFPQLEAIKVDYTWEGLMSYARHQMAQIGQVAPNVWYGIGFGGHGVVPTTVAGEVLAQAITGENKTWQSFKPWGLPWNGSFVGSIAAQSSYWWYQLCDWLKEKSLN